MKPLNADSQSCDPISSNLGYRIYSLLDPVKEEVKYIGLTSRTLDTRLQEHLTIDCRYYKGNWIISLKKKGIQPIIELLEDNLTINEAIVKEKQYILLFKSFGATLTNLTKGGDGISGYKHTEETKKILSIKHEGENNHMFGKTHSEESLDKMRKSQKGSNNGFYNKTHTKESKTKIKEARTKQVMRKGWKHSQESILKMSVTRLNNKKLKDEASKP